MFYVIVLTYLLYHVYICITIQITKQLAYKNRYNYSSRIYFIKTIHIEFHFASTTLIANYFVNN